LVIFFKKIGLAGPVCSVWDSRKVNALTEKDAYPLPQVSGIHSRLSKAEFITILD